MQLSFSHKKAVQVLNVLAMKAGGTLNKMKALKLIYFADRYHLRRFGRPITNDTYFAMKYGPVASACKDLLNATEETEVGYSSQYIDTTQGHDFSSVCPVDEMVFSESDKQALDFAWQHYHSKNQFQLAEETHRFPEWQKHQTALESGTASRRLMPYSDFVLNAEAGIDPSPALDPEQQADIREELDEMHSIESIWS